jgi:hypothetical protein
MTDYKYLAKLEAAKRLVDEIRIIASKNINNHEVDSLHEDFETILSIVARIKTI